MKKFAHLLVLSLVALSCRIGDLESLHPVQIVNPDYSPRHQEFIRFKANLETYSTKASLNFEDSKQIWDKGDMVLVCDQESGKEALYEALSGGKDTTTLVRVSGDTLSADAGKIFTAYYPVEYKSGELPSKITYSGSSVVGQIPMKAQGSRNFTFENDCALVRCTYKPAEDMLVKKIIFSSEVPLCGDGPVEMDCTYASPAGLTMYGGRVTTFSLFMTPGVYPSFKVCMSGDDAYEEVVLEYELEVVRNVITDVDLNMPDGKVTNLGKLETANSYVIYNPGEYLFPAVKGCSQESVEGIESVEVLWEMDNQETAPTSKMISSVRYSSGKITFTTPETFKTGNALIAAKDKGGNILWSWHIWACEDAISTLKHDTEGKYLLMDRSLGALAKGVSNPADNKYASSLLYQWGRKDPFPGQTTQGNRNLIVTSGVQRTISAGPVSISQAISTPTVFYTGEQDWVEMPDATLWNSTQKTIYDPCPPGYIVPSKEVFSESADIFYTGYVESSGSKGGSFRFSADGGKWYCFPLSAYFKGTDGARDGKGTVYTWTSDCYETLSISCYMYYASKKTHIEPSNPLSRSAAASVRCIKIIKND